MLPFSPGPVPTTSDDVADRLTAGLRSLLRPREAASVQVECSGATAEHLTSIRIDLSGADLDPIAAELPPVGGTPVTVDHVSLTGQPVRVRGVPGRLHGELRALPAVWTTDGAGLLWLLPQEQGQVGSAHGQVQISARVADLEQAMLTIGGPLLAERGFTLTSARLEVATDGSSAARVRVQAQVRRGILSATVEGSGRISVDESLVLTISDLTLTSANPLVSMGLAMVHRQLQDWQGRRIDLGAHLVGGLAVSTVSLSSSDGEVAVTARVGQ